MRDANKLAPTAAEARSHFEQARRIGPDDDAATRALWDAARAFVLAERDRQRARGNREWLDNLAGTPKPGTIHHD